MAGAGRTRLALDHNFPEPILRALDQYIVDVELVPLRAIDTRMPNLEDRELIIALHQLGFPGLVTANYKMLKNPRELSALMVTKLTVFAIQGVGDDPLRATGALLLDLPGALNRFDPSKTQVFWLRPRDPQPQDPWELFATVANHQQESRQQLFQRLRPSEKELSTQVLT